MRPDVALEQVKAQARAVLQRNDAGEFTKPSLKQYPHQWNWDSALAALGWSHFDLPRARAEVRSLLRAQWRDGMVPHVVYHRTLSPLLVNNAVGLTSKGESVRHDASVYFPPANFWQVEGVPHAGALPSSGITQPPILATVVRALHEREQMTSGEWRDSRHPSRVTHHAFVREVYPQLLAWHRWLHAARDADGSGLPYLMHPWESGMDNSPRWTPALDRITPTHLPPFRRRDAIHVSPDERPLDADYERYVYLIDLGRRARWDTRWLVDYSPFLVQDVMFCAILHRADEDLRALALLLGEETREIDGWMAGTRQAFGARFWDETRGLYCDYDLRARAPLRVNACATFAPLFAGLASQAQAARLVAEHFDNPSEYAPNADSRYRLPSTSKQERGYSPRRYWCGPIWIVTNWLIAEGLRRYGFAEQADALRQDSLALMQAQGFREYYDPRDGTGLGATDFSWSAALALEMIKV